jgi:hypothetical protein
MEALFNAGCKYSPDFVLRGRQVQPAPAQKALN